MTVRSSSQRIASCWISWPIEGRNLRHSVYWRYCCWHYYCCRPYCRVVGHPAGISSRTVPLWFVIRAGLERPCVQRVPILLVAPEGAWIVA